MNVFANIRWFFREEVTLKLQPVFILLVALLAVGAPAYFAGYLDGRHSMKCYKDAARYEAYWPRDRRPPEYDFQARVKKCGQQADKI